MSAAYFESCGMWAATSTAPDAALEAVQELKPDVIVTDLGFQGQSLGADFIHTLRSSEETRNIGVILLSGRGLSELPETARVEADLCLVKPVLPDLLVSKVRRLAETCRETRAREAAARATHTELAERVQSTLTESRRLADLTEARQRVCPDCGHRLDWMERGRLAGSEYDYYRWCPKGCGLYCYDRGASQWVKLA
jgi:CheY-like chemotaxis protein